MSSNRIRNFVRRKIRWFDRPDNTSARGALATLRRGLGKSPLDVPEIWAFTLADSHDDGPASPPQGGMPTKEEWAVHTALTLYALHRQGRSESVSDEGESGEKAKQGPSFGAAMRMLSLDSDNGAERKPGVVRRFNAMITADGLPEFSRHALGAVQLMRADGRCIRFDYPAFAADLFSYQFPESRARVALKWGRDFWRGFETADNADAVNNADEKEEDNGQ